MNQILRAVPVDNQQRLRRKMERVQLTSGKVLYEQGDIIGEVYFPQTAIISVVLVTSEGDSVEVASVGKEGILGICRFYGEERAIARAVVLVPGEAWRMQAPVFEAEFLADQILSSEVRRYAHAYLFQVTRSSACNRLHSVEQRCARWLLTLSDRCETGAFPVTQEFVAEILGVRRQTAAIVLTVLEEKGLIHNQRKQIRIRDRRGLEQVACECYGIVSTHLHLA
ncbi:Crp/Fnr family transcriptional regulator [Candidatus Nitrospira bockiana]